MANCSGGDLFLDQITAQTSAVPGPAVSSIKQPTDLQMGSALRYMLDTGARRPPGSIGSGMLGGHSCYSSAQSDGNALGGWDAVSLRRKDDISSSRPVVYTVLVNISPRKFCVVQ